jgi:divalent metal cation (Fe/Co/Zn/Cd) transporter
MDRHPDQSFPDGFRRAATLAFLVSATAVLTLGVYILIDSAIKLITRYHPSIPMMQLFGHYVWAGWVMIPVLVYSAIPPIVLGHMKLPLAKRLHDRTLFADADMNKADWQTALAAIVGIVLVGYGLWWGDAVAASLIALNICKDGVQRIGSAFAQLMNQRPMDIEGKEPDTDVEEIIRQSLVGFDWIEEVQLRLHEDGHLISGVAFLKIAGDRSVSAEMIEAARSTLARRSWRVYCVELVPVGDLD